MSEYYVDKCLCETPIYSAAGFGAEVYLICGNCSKTEGGEWVADEINKMIQQLAHQHDIIRWLSKAVVELLGLPKSKRRQRLTSLMAFDKAAGKDPEIIKGYEVVLGNTLEDEG